MGRVDRPRTIPGAASLRLLPSCYWLVARKSSFGTHSFCVVISEGPFLLVGFPELTPLKGLQIQNLSKWSWQSVYYHIRKNPYLPREGFYFLMF